VAGIALLVGLGTAACANPTYDPGSTRRELMDAGLTRDQATCVVRAMDDRFGDRKLRAHQPVKPSERKRFAEILAGCDVSVSPGAARSS